MAIKDRIKEELAWLKVVFVIFTAIDVSLIAWLVQYFQAAHLILVVSAVLIVLFITLILIWVNRAALKRFIQLEKIE